MINGTLYDSSNPSGTEVYSGAGANGCDSIVTVSLTVLPAINIATSQSGVNLSAIANGLAYQWIDCNNNQAMIVGETNQDYVATDNGSYAVVVSENNCSDTSTCLVVNSVGLEEMSSLGNIKIYPNPSSNGSFFISLDANSKDRQMVSIYSSIGALVYTRALDKKNTKICTEDFSSGIYLIQISDGLSKEIVHLIVD